MISYSIIHQNRQNEGRRKTLLKISISLEDKLQQQNANTTQFSDLFDSIKYTNSPLETSNKLLLGEYELRFLRLQHSNNELNKVLNLKFHKK